MSILNLIKKTKKKIKKIDNLDIKNIKKIKLYKKISLKYKKYLKKRNISIFTYSKYISLLRRQFTNKKHYNFNKKINLLINKFKYYKKEIKTLKNKSINKIFINIYILKKKLLNIEKLLILLNTIKIKNKYNKKIYKNIIKKIPNWKQEIKFYIKSSLYEGNKYLINKIQQGLKLIKIIIKLKINHEFLFYLKIEKNKIIIIKNKSLEALKKKKKNIININYISYMQKIYNILYTIKYLNNYNNISAICFALSAISGRRMIEILYLGKFKKKNNYQITFIGQAKSLKKNKKYIIYILINSNIFLNKLYLLRKCFLIQNIFYKIKKKKNKLISKNSQISNYISFHLNKWVKKFFNNKTRTYKDSRSIYAQIMLKYWYKKDKKWKNYDKDYFITKILGHKNINCQMYYKQFKIKNFNINWFPIKPKNNKLNKLNKLNNKLKNIIKRKTSYKIHEITKKIIQKEPNKIITSYLLRKYGFNTKLIQRYIKFISKYIY